MDNSTTEAIQLFTENFPRNRKKYLNYALYLVHDPNVIEDMVNDSFAKIWEKRKEISDTNIEAYFYTVVKNNCLDLLRKRAIRYRVHQQIEDTSYSLLQYDIASLETLDQNSIFSNEIREIMLRQLKEMPELSGKIFMDNRFSNLSYEDIAKKYGIPKFKVSLEIQAALKRLRISLRDYLPTELVAVFLTLIHFL